MNRTSAHDIKKNAWASIDREFSKIVLGLQSGDSVALSNFLEYCSGKTSRWSLINIAKLYSEGIQNPVTDSQLPQLQHRLKPGAQKTWIFMPVLIDESGEVIASGSRPVEVPKREDADRIQLAPPTADIVQWLNANPATKPMLWEAFTRAVPPVDLPATDSESFVPWWTQRQENFSGWVAERHGSEIKAWTLARPSESLTGPDDSEGAQKRPRLAYALSRVIVDLYKMTTGPEVPKPNVNPKRVFHLLSRYAKEEGIQVVGLVEGQGSTNEIALNHTDPENVKVIALAGGLVERAFALRSGGDDSEVRQAQIDAATFIVAKTLGVPAKCTVENPSAWGADIKTFSETMRGVAAVSQGIVRGVIQTINLAQIERQAELQRQIQDKATAEAQAAEEAIEDHALAESIAEPNEELAAMSAG